MPVRKQHNSGFKAQVALEAIKNQRTIAEIASEYGVPTSQVNKWKWQALDGIPTIIPLPRSHPDYGYMILPTIIT